MLRLYLILVHFQLPFYACLRMIKKHNISWTYLSIGIRVIFHVSRISGISWISGFGILKFIFIAIYTFIKNHCNCKIQSLVCEILLTSVLSLRMQAFWKCNESYITFSGSWPLYLNINSKFLRNNQKGKKYRRRDLSSLSISWTYHWPVGAVARICARYLT